MIVSQSPASMRAASDSAERRAMGNWVSMKDEVAVADASRVRVVCMASAFIIHPSSFDDKQRRSAAGDERGVYVLVERGEAAPVLHGETEEVEVGEVPGSGERREEAAV